MLYRVKYPGDTPLYKPYSYVPPLRVGSLRRFGLKTDIDFAHFSLDSDMVFERIMVVTINVFIASIPND